MNSYIDKIVKPFVVITILAITITSCKPGKKINESQKSSPEPCEPITFTNDLYENIETDYYSVDSIFIDNNCLNIWVNYSGGCGDSEFKLLYNNKIMKSMPPQTNLMLHFTDNDNCRALVQQKLYYDLSFFEEYANNGGIKLRMMGINSTIMYTK